MFNYIWGLLCVLLSGTMKYATAQYFIFVSIVLIIYYKIPKIYRWIVLLFSSFYFYISISTNIKQIFLFVFSIIFSYVLAIIVKICLVKKVNSILTKFILWIGILGSACPLILVKCTDFVLSSINGGVSSFIVPIGLAFYSMQIVSYLVDVYRKKIYPELNLFKYALYISFFPIIIQGPISRFDQLSKQLSEGHSFDYEKILSGMQLILWGLFLKYMIADKAGVIVNNVFAQYKDYSGSIVLVSGILYSIQLYADFQSCVTMSQGVSSLFGIDLIDNFNHPYFSTSIKDFWRRWHISLSSWLRDYIYIPLGGNRKGKKFKFFNLFLTFTVSGIWHGASWKFLFWGWLHAAYQIIGELTYSWRNDKLEKIHISKTNIFIRIIRTINTFVLAMIGWIIFRADTLKMGFDMIVSIFVPFETDSLENPIYSLGLNENGMKVLLISIGILFIVSLLQENGFKIRKWLNRRSFILRWCVYLLVIWSIWIFGTYGFGFNATDFIYGGF